MEPTNEQLRALPKAVVATRPEEIDCDELLARVGALLETLERGEELPADRGLVSQHLVICPECREEFDALVELYER